MITPTQEVLAEKLWGVGAIKIDTKKGFLLKAHESNPNLPPSPIYLELRDENHPKKPGPLTPEIFNLIGDEFFSAINANEQAWDFDWFADIPHAGTPFGDQIERIMSENVITDLGRLQLHKTEFADGSRQIDRNVDVMYGGQLYPYDRVLLVDDLITKAGTKLEAIAALEKNDLKVVTVLVLVDRGTGAQELRDLGYNVVAVMSLPDMIRHYKEAELIDPNEYQVIRQYLGF